MASIFTPEAKVDDKGRQEVVLQRIANSLVKNCFTGNNNLHDSALSAREYLRRRLRRRMIFFPADFPD